MSDEHTFTSDQAAAANTALRMALKLPPEQFGIRQFVAMISDEVEQLRRTGVTDEEIAALVQESTGGVISGEDITRHYAPAEERGRAGGAGSGDE